MRGSTRGLISRQDRRLHLKNGKKWSKIGIIIFNKWQKLAQKIAKYSKNWQKLV